MPVSSWQEMERNYICDMAATVTLTPTSENTSYPKTNLLDYARWKQFKFGASGAQSIVIDLGGNVNVNTVCLANHNKGSASWGTTKIQHGTSASGPWTDAATLQFSTDWGLGINDTQDYFQTFGTTHFKRYWKFDIASSTSAPAFGILGLGRIFEYKDADIDEFAVYFDANTYERRSESGAMFVAAMGRPVREWHLRRTGIPRENEISDIFAYEIAQGVNFLSSVNACVGTWWIHRGNLRPFFFMTRPYTGLVQSWGHNGTRGECHYVRWPKRMGVRERFVNQFNDDEAIVFREEQ